MIPKDPFVMKGFFVTVILLQQVFLRNAMEEDGWGLAIITLMRNTFARISLERLAGNVRVIQNRCGAHTKLCAVVKANAYGHGLVAVAHELEKMAVDYMAVALVEEGVMLREAGIRTPILVLGGISHSDAMIALQHHMTLTVSSIEKLEILVEQAALLKIVPTVHMKIDTGMGRVGVQYDRATAFLKQVTKYHQTGKIFCEGIYSHFAESTDEEYTKLQFDRFVHVCAEARNLGLTHLIRHISSSRALFLFPEFNLDMVRPGIALYGVEPEADQTILPKEIQPVLSLETEIVYFKVLKQGDPVGYGRTWQVGDEYERIVTLPVGYADGCDRRLGNIGQVIIRCKKYGIVGRVCMDQCMVSLGKNGVGYVGDRVTLIGNQVVETGNGAADETGNETGELSISVSEIAQLVGTTPHEILVSITDRVPRVYE